MSDGLTDGAKMSGVDGGFPKEPATRPSTPEAKGRRLLMYLMHPLGGGPKRELNRWLACQWQAKVQEAHPEWLVIAPWIALTGAWKEDRREEGMAIDFATIDLCDGGIITGVTDGPVTSVQLHRGVSVGMSLELNYFHDRHRQKPVYDVRQRFQVEVPQDFKPPRPMVSEFLPRYTVGRQVMADGKLDGTCHIEGVEETAPGVFYYTVEQRVRFRAHEQALKPFNT